MTRKTRKQNKVSHYTDNNCSYRVLMKGCRKQCNSSLNRQKDSHTNREKHDPHKNTFLPNQITKEMRHNSIACQTEQNRNNGVFMQ